MILNWLIFQMGWFNHQLERAWHFIRPKPNFPKVTGLDRRGESLDFNGQYEGYILQNSTWNPNQKHVYFQIFQMNLLAFVVAIARQQMFLVFLWFHMSFTGSNKENLTQRMVDQISIPILKVETFISRSFGWVSNTTKFWILYRSLRVQISYFGKCHSPQLVNGHRSLDCFLDVMACLVWFLADCFGLLPFPLFPIERWLFSEPQKLQLLFFWVVFCCREFHSQGLISIPEQWQKNS